MSLHSAEYVIWLVAAGLQAGLLVALWKRRLWARYPFFSAYAALQVLSATLLFLLGHDSVSSSLTIYWLSSAVSVVLLVGILRELLTHAFEFTPRLQDLGSILCRWSSAVIVLAVIAGLIHARQPTISANFQNGVLFAQASTRSILFVLLLFLLPASRYLKLSRGGLGFGIGLGLTLFFVVDMMAATLASYQGQFPGRLYHEIDGLGYVASCLIWLGYAIFRFN